MVESGASEGKKVWRLCDPNALPLARPCKRTQEALLCPSPLGPHRPAPNGFCGITTSKSYGPFCKGMLLQYKYCAQGSDLTRPNPIQLSYILSAFSHF